MTYRIHKFQAKQLQDFVLTILISSQMKQPIRIAAISTQMHEAFHAQIISSLGNVCASSPMLPPITVDKMAQTVIIRSNGSSDNPYTPWKTSRMFV